jgi:hypothetical protein
MSMDKCISLRFLLNVQVMQTLTMIACGGWEQAVIHTFAEDDQINQTGIRHIVFCIC